MGTKFEHDELDAGGLDDHRRVRLTRSVLLKSDMRYVALSTCAETTSPSSSLDWHAKKAKRAYPLTSV